LGTNNAAFLGSTIEDLGESVMINEESRDPAGKPDSPGVNKDEQDAPANPAPRGPTRKDEPGTETVDEVKTDAAIEDRFEATDN
jgi:hypothetical protein